MTQRKTSLTEKMVVYTLLLATPAMAWFGSYVWYSSQEAIIERTFQQLISVRVEKQQNLEQYLGERLLDASRFVLADTTSSVPTGFTQVICQQTRRHDSAIPNNLICDTAFLTERPSLPVVRQAPLYALVFDAQGRLFQFSFSEQSLNQIMVNKNPYSGLGTTGEAYLTGNDTLMRSTSRFHHNAILTTKVTTSGIYNALNGETATGEYADYRGVEILGAYAPFHFRGIKWVISAEIDSAEALEPVVKLGRNILFMGIFAALAIFSAVWFAARTITRPLLKLRDAAEKISDGDFEQHIDIISGDETGALTDSFNHMALTLKKQSKQIQEERLHRMRAMIDGQEMERQRLSREIHDSLGQNLLAVHMLLNRTTECDLHETRQFTTPACEIVKETIAEARAIINNLRPPALTELGLNEALHNLCRDAEVTGSITIERNLTTTILPDAVAIYLYRIVQEALQNILKHAHASTVWIDLTTENQSVSLTISDNGQGFELDNITTGTNGLNNMRERTLILGGQFALDSTPETGTTLTVKIRLNHDQP